MVQVLLITGPAGVGKSTLSWEIGAQLAKAGVRHAAIETDELDRAYPLPSASELEVFRPGMSDVSEANLASIWRNYEALGYGRLVMSGVMVNIGSDREWIARAIPNAAIIAVRLLASYETLLERIGRREIGSGKDDQITRTFEHVRQIASRTDDDMITLRTDQKLPRELASELLMRIGWCS